MPRFLGLLPVTAAVSTFALYSIAIRIATTTTQHLVVAYVFAFPLVCSAIIVGIASSPIHSASSTLSLHPSFVRFAADRGVLLLLTVCFVFVRH